LTVLFSIQSATGCRVSFSLHFLGHGFGLIPAPSSLLLLGLLLNTFFNLWWADPVAAVIMGPIIVREGIEGVRDKACDDCRCA